MKVMKEKSERDECCERINVSGFTSSRLNVLNTSVAFISLIYL